MYLGNISIKVESEQELHRALQLVKAVGWPSFDSEEDQPMFASPGKTYYLEKILGEWFVLRKPNDESNIIHDIHSLEILVGSSVKRKLGVDVLFEEMKIMGIQIPMRLVDDLLEVFERAKQVELSNLEDCLPGTADYKEKYLRENYER
jgi:hypothetical protein